MEVERVLTKSDGHTIKSAELKYQEVTKDSCAEDEEWYRY
jgi:hypothetical protein